MQTPVMSTRRRNRLTITRNCGTTMISLGEIEIWDGADLALIRDTLFEQIQDFGRRDIGIDLRTVKYIPSGFFGMLSDWHDRGIRISAIGVQENVSRMLWFKLFFREITPGSFLLSREPNDDVNLLIELDDEEDDIDASEGWQDDSLDSQRETSASGSH